MASETITETRTIKKVKTLKDKSDDWLVGRTKHKFLIWEFETQLIWTNIIFIIIWHAVGIYVLLQYFLYIRTPAILIYCFWMGGVSGFGITAGAHRLWTHRAYKAKLPLQAILLVCYSVAGQNSLLEWVQDHRVHHKFSETDADPHNAKRGFFFSHVGWLMMKKHPEVIRKGRQIDCSDILEEPMVAFYQKHFNWFKLLFCIIVPSAIPPLCWGETWYRSIVANFFVRYMLTANVTWCVNSLAHYTGWRPYDKTIYPAENWLVSFMAMGEGWHNYHHTFPWDYRTAEVGHWLNASTAWLNFFYMIGWAYDMKTASPELTASIAHKRGDGSWNKLLDNGKKDRIRMKGR